MKGKGQHLTLYLRERIEIGLAQGKKIREIGRELQLNHSVVSREIKRNKNQQTGQYIACKADQKAKRREKLQRQKAPLKEPEIFLYVKCKLMLGWSPETISGRIKIDLPGCKIAPETIYSFIYNKAKHPHQDFRNFLAHAHVSRRKKPGRKVKSTFIPGKTMIDERSPLIHLRTDYGHFETDLMEGKRSDQKAVSVHTERKTRFTKLNLVANKSALEKTNSIKQLSSLKLKTITTDNGSENAGYQQWQSLLGVSVYFTNPYHSWEKGTVENTIGRLRYFIPKHTSIQYLTQNHLNVIEYLMNTTPRKCLEYLTPLEVIKKELDGLQYPSLGGAFQVGI